MRRLSKKRQKDYRDMKPLREAYLKEFERCVACDCAAPHAVHEIASGTAGRPKAFKQPACWLPLCTFCNCNRMTDKDLWPVARQLALKLVRDPKRFDLQAFNECYTLGMVHLEEVVRWLTVVG